MQRMNPMIGAVALSLILSVQPQSAQASPRQFSLPTPAPTPTPAPQGPADELGGVRIGPRLIPQESTQPSPENVAAEATPPPAQPLDQAEGAPPSVTSRSPENSPPDGAQQGPSAIESATQTPRRELAPSPAQSIDPPSVQDDFDRAIPPSPETAATPELDAAEGDGWYDVTRDGEVATGAPQTNRSTAPGEARLSGAEIAAQQAQTLQYTLIAAVALLVLLAGVVAWLLWRRRRSQTLLLEGPGQTLVAGVSQQMAEQMKPLMPSSSRGGRKPIAPAVSPAGEQNIPTPAFPSIDPKQIDLSIEVGSATRSVMMFSADIRLDIMNRADHAVRNLNVYAQLACAQKGAGNGAPIATGQPLSEIARIGPHQSQRVSGALQLSLSDVKTLKQGAKPLFIPLLHVTIEGGGQQLLQRSYVLGSPSATSQTRLHPLPLDGPPGSLPGLKAQRIKQPTVETQQA